MSAITELAERLGRAIADSPQVAALKAARDAMKNAPEAEQLFMDFREQTDKVARLQQDKKPIEVDDKRRLQDLHEKLIACEAFKQLTAAQVEYVDLMRKVNESIRQHIDENQNATGDSSSP